MRSGSAIATAGFPAQSQCIEWAISVSAQCSKIVWSFVASQLQEIPQERQPPRPRQGGECTARRARPGGGVVWWCHRASSLRARPSSNPESAGASPVLPPGSASAGQADTLEDQEREPSMPP